MNGEPAISNKLLSEIEADANVADGISNDRKAHIFSVVGEAVSIAAILFPLYGIAKEYFGDVKAAALLHDATKEWSQKEQLSFCNLHGIILSEDDLNCPPTIHSITGAYAAEEKYSINKRIFDAIYKHTTGSGEMNLFDKIIFLADYIEPGRRYRECATVRDFFHNGIKSVKSTGDADTLLDICVCLSCMNTIRHLKDKGFHVHKNTVFTVKSLCKMHPNEANFNSFTTELEETR